MLALREIAIAPGSIDMTAQLDALLSRLDKVRNHGHGKFFAACPAHVEKTGSLYVTLKDSGKVTIHCFGGCRSDDVLAAICMTFKDLMPPRVEYRRGTPAAQVPVKPLRRHLDERGHDLLFDTAIIWERCTEHQAICWRMERERMYAKYGPSLRPLPKITPPYWAVAARNIGETPCA